MLATTFPKPETLGWDQQGWLKVDGKELLFVTDDPRDLAGASEACRQVGGRLAELTDEKEIDAAGAAAATLMSARGNFTLEFMIGGWERNKIYVLSA